MKATLEITVKSRPTYVLLEFDTELDFVPTKRFLFSFSLPDYYDTLSVDFTMWEIDTKTLCICLDCIELKTSEEVIDRAIELQSLGFKISNADDKTLAALGSKKQVTDASPQAEPEPKESSVVPAASPGSL